MKRNGYWILGMVGIFSTSLFAEESIDLSGAWRIALDRQSTGVQTRWYEKNLPGEDKIQLPGSMQAQGFGDIPGPSTPWTGDIQQDGWNKPEYAPYRTAENFKMPFWLQPDKYYKGAAWYQKTVTIPKSWKDKHITLTLERPHWKTTVWIDSSDAGSINYLSAAHVYDLSRFLTPGEHKLTLCVDNRMSVDVGVNSHSVSDHTQSNWNGIVGKIELQARSAVWIEDVQAYPDIKNQNAKIRFELKNHTGGPSAGELECGLFFEDRLVNSITQKVTVNTDGSRMELVIPAGDGKKFWNEFNPNLYTLKTRLKTPAGDDEKTVTFGMRQVELAGNRITLNGRRVFMRGTLECCIFPKTGYPPTDVESWKRIITICKAHGLNHIRFHSWCPPEAAFIAADEMGFYYQVECSSWCNYGKIGPGSGTPVDQWLYDEADAILKAYGNHPSFVLFTYGNEPGGPEQGAVYLRKWAAHYKQKDSRRLVTSGSGWPQIEESDYHVTPSPRIQAWGQGLASRINSKAPETVTDYRDFVNRYPSQAVIAHEIGQWCVYPNFDEMKKYTGVLKAKNFEIFRDFLEQKGMLDMAHDFLMASGKLQTLCYKEDIESNMRTPNIGGFQLLDLHDFPGQGTALVGVLDPFWDSKPYVSPVEYNRFCAPIVPLARLPKRIFTSSDTLTAQIDVSQFGSADLADASVRWSLLDIKGNTIKKGDLQKGTLPAGDLYTVGNISIKLSDLPTPAKYVLELAIKDTKAVNDWDIWVYPDTVNTQAQEGVVIATGLDETTISQLQNGVKVLLALKPSQIKTNVKLGFSSIFWNTAWTGGQPPHTLGILCNPKHAALAAFPTEYHSNWQWSEPIQNAAVMEMDLFPPALRPIVQVVPDWFEPKKLGLVFEAKVGRGKLLVCSVNILDDLEHRPVKRQLRYSLLEYMRSENFKPEQEVDIKSIQSFLRQPTAMEKLGAKIIFTDSSEPGNEGANAIDNDPLTLWHTRWSEKKDACPHEIQIEFKQSVAIQGVTVLPRQDGNPNGWVKTYAVYVSEDAAKWQQPISTGEFEKNSKLKMIRFDKPAAGRYLRFVALEGFEKDTFTSIAEMDLLL